MDILEPGLLNCPEEAVLPPPDEKKICWRKLETVDVVK
jgi:hypothetical protein